MQIPLAAIRIPDEKCGGKVVYLVDKNRNLATAQGLLKLLHSQPNNDVPSLTKETVQSLFQLSESESERERLTYAIPQASGLSATKLRNLYGFQDVKNRRDKVELAVARAKEIRESIDFVAHIKEKAVLRSFGVSVESDTDDAYESEESCSDSEYSICDETVSEACNDSSNDNVPTEAPSLTSFFGECSNNDMYNGKAEGSHEFSLPENPDICKQVTETGETYLNTHQLMDLLQECQLNWYCFAEVMKQKLASHGKEHLLDQVLLDFSGQIPFLNITLHNEKLIEQSRQAYLADQRSNNL